MKYKLQFYCSFDEEWTDDTDHEGWDDLQDARAVAQVEHVAYPRINFRIVEQSVVFSEVVEEFPSVD